MTNLLVANGPKATKTCIPVAQEASKQPLPVLLASYPLHAPELESALSEAEIEIARALVVGDKPQTIAERRGTSTRTVRNQIGRIFAKLGVNSIDELCVRYVDEGAQP